MHPANAKALQLATDEFLGQDRRGMTIVAAQTMYQRALAKAGKSVFVDKTPRYYHCLDEIEQLNEGSNVICLLRNPLDVAASYKTTWGIDISEVLRNKADTPEFLDFAFGFDRLSKLASEGRCHVIRYEELVEHPQQEMDKLFRYLGVPLVEVSNSLNVSGSHFATSSVGDKNILRNQSISTSSIDAYKSVLSVEEVRIIAEGVGSVVFERLGYQSALASSTSGGHILNGEVTSEIHATAMEYLTARNFEMESDSMLAKIELLTQENNSTRAELVAVDKELNRTRELLKPRRYARHLMNVAISRLASREREFQLPKISVVTPCYNCVEFIEEAITSVLDQDYPDLEYTIVDGGSTDGTLEKIEECLARERYGKKRVTVISEPDEGMYDALQKGFRRSTGDVQCYLNADDRFEPGALLSVGEHFARRPKIDVLYHNDCVLAENWKFKNVGQPITVNTADLLNRHILFQDGVFWRKRAYDSVGGIRAQFKLAGDFDLWLRLSRRYRFHRAEGEVSLFRLRPGQLSTNMTDYLSEMDLSVKEFLASTTSWQKLRYRLEGVAARLRRSFDTKPQKHLNFPIDFPNLPPPPVDTPPHLTEAPRGPVDRKIPAHFLFSTPDTRFGQQEINYVYHDANHDIAVVHPPVDDDKLDGLYRAFYTSPPDTLKIPEGNSPFRGFDGRSYLEKLLLRVPVERFARFFPKAWEDQTLHELEATLKAAGVGTQSPLRILDLGCFEGSLLDKIKEQTNWKPFGFEPNFDAVTRARAKGHHVWHGHAEDVLEAIPAEQHFDVVFMGQTIEHVNDPLAVFKRVRFLLAPGGLLVMSTPNLRSKEIKFFGPTWAHWHAPYHRHIFSLKGLAAIGMAAGMRMVTSKTYSHPYWSTMSVALNKLGLAGGVSHAVPFDRSTSLMGLRLYIFHRIFWDRFGRGDYFFMAFKDG